MCVEYSNRLCVKAIYLLLYEAIYNLCNIFKEIKSIVCKFKIIQRTTRNTWAINALHWNSFHVRTTPFDFNGLEMKCPSLFFSFFLLEIIESLLNVS